MAYLRHGSLAVSLGSMANRAHIVRHVGSGYAISGNSGGVAGDGLLGICIIAQSADHAIGKSHSCQLCRDALDTFMVVEYGTFFRHIDKYGELGACGCLFFLQRDYPSYIK